VSQEQAADTRPADASAEAFVRPAASIAELATTWVSAAGSRVKDTAQLALAEARLAAMSVALMVLLAIIAAVFLLGAWGMLMAGVVTGINELGVPIWITLLALGVTHLLCAWLLIRLTLKLSVHLELPATRRQLRGVAAPDGDDDVA
jgi:uncharacterized membrane protein YqjE